MGEQKKSIKCDLCGSPATVHLTQVVNNDVHKINLCSDCAHKKGVNEGEEFSIADMLSAQFDEALAFGMLPGANQPKCNNCGCTVPEFNKEGLLGCPQCYEVFYSVLKPLFRTMHKGMTHFGKVPSASINRLELKAKKEKLEQELQDCIKEERYEDAALLRDKIKSLEKNILDGDNPD